MWQQEGRKEHRPTDHTCYQFISILDMVWWAIWLWIWLLVLCLCRQNIVTNQSNHSYLQEALIFMFDWHQLSFISFAMNCYIYIMIATNISWPHRAWENTEMNKCRLPHWQQPTHMFTLRYYFYLDLLAVRFFFFDPFWALFLERLAADLYLWELRFPLPWI